MKNRVKTQQRSGASEFSNIVPSIGSQRGRETARDGGLRKNRLLYSDKTEIPQGRSLLGDSLAIALVLAIATIGSTLFQAKPISESISLLFARSFLAENANSTDQQPNEPRRNGTPKTPDGTGNYISTATTDINLRF
ncbi:MAG: hypothetical protein F6J93_31820 [Oscillatoria sp. SIO1A7]|nr:hypothetical protein [Oscillatoria sp. SIO1A7]